MGKLAKQIEPIFHISNLVTEMRLNIHLTQSVHFIIADILAPV